MRFGLASFNTWDGNKAIRPLSIIIIGNNHDCGRTDDHHTKRQGHGRALEPPLAIVFALLYPFRADSIMAVRNGGSLSLKVIRFDLYARRITRRNERAIKTLLLFRWFVCCARFSMADLSWVCDGRVLFVRRNEKITVLYVVRTEVRS